MDASGTQEPQKLERASSLVRVGDEIIQQAQQALNEAQATSLMVDCHELRIKIGSALERVPSGGLQFRLAMVEGETELNRPIRALTDPEARRMNIDKVEEPDVFLQWMQWRHECRAKLLQ